MTFFTNGTNNVRKSFIQVGHDSASWSAGVGELSLNPFGGNVGIGTTSPAHKLDVDGSINTTGDITVGHTINFNRYPSGGITTLSVVDDSPNNDNMLELITENGKYLRFGPGNTTWCHFNTDATNGFYFADHVTLGTGQLRAYSGTDLKLVTDGSTRLSIGDTSGVIRFNNAYSFPTTDGSADQVLKTDGAGQLSWTTMSTGGDPNTDSQTLFFNSGTNILSITGGNNVDLSSLIDDTNLWTENSGRIYRNGLVGIGGDPDIYPLQVTSNSLPWVNIQSEESGGMSPKLWFQNNPNNPSNVSNGSPIGMVDFGGGGSVLPTSISGLKESNGTSLQFDMSDGASTQTTALYLAPTGRVGVNSTSPDTNLHVAGSIKMVDGNEQDGYVLTSDAYGLASWKYNPTPIVIYATTEQELIDGLLYFKTKINQVLLS